MKPAPAFWYPFLFLVGAASIAVEIAGLRFLAPIFGTSLPVWGSVIATVIAGLALGYSHGGRRAKAGADELVVFKYAAAAAVIFLFMPAGFRLAENLPPAAAVLPALGILFIPSVIFGAVSPLAVQAETTRRGEPAGQVAGRISTLTTLGSLFGILIPSFLTIPLLGSRETVWIFAGAVLLLSLPVIVRARRYVAFLFLGAGLGTLLGNLPTAPDPDTFFTKETPYQHVEVSSVSGGRALIFDASLGVQSFFTSAPYTDGYWDYLAALPAFFAKDHLNILVLGAAASTTERQMESFWEGQKTFDFTSVELDGQLFPIADEYFSAPPRQQVTSDARLFAKNSDEQYDIIVVDTYARELTVPFHLATREFFGILAPRLSAGGLVAVNANANSLDTAWIKSLSRTMGKIFPNIRIASIPESCNHLLLATQDPLPQPKSAPVLVAPLLPVLETTQPPSGEGLLLTDNRAPTDWLGLAALLQTSSEPSCA